MTRDEILDRIQDFGEDDVTEIVDYLASGILTMQDLRENGLNFKVRKSVEKTLQERQVQKKNADELAWNAAALADTEDDYSSYLRNFINGCHRDEARAALRRLDDKKAETAMEDLWQRVDKSSSDELEAFVAAHPESRFVGDAKARLRQLRDFAYAQENAMENLKVKVDDSWEPYDTIREALDSRSVTVDQLLDEIDRDNNWLAAATIKSLIDAGRLTYADIEGCGIDSAFVKELRKGTAEDGDSKRTIRKAFRELDSVSRLDSKDREIALTEVYFWGIPSSGKTCALGAILEAADNGNVAKSFRAYEESQGYGYMNELPRFFKRGGKVCLFPGSTDVSASYAMGLELTDQADSVHPLTFVDFAGELIATMYKYYADPDSMRDEEKQSLDTLTNVLISNRTGNRKIHFFVVEYGAEDREVRSVGLPQKNVLRAAMGYVDKTGIFSSSTDAIYLIVTKVDKMKLSPDDKRRGLTRDAKLRQYVAEKYGSFYESLRQICRQNQINGGELPVLGFSIGKVCFRDFFIYNPESAESIVRLILHRSHGSSNSGLVSRLVSFFKS